MKAKHASPIKALPVRPIIVVNKKHRRVIWRAVPPPYINEMTHKFSILDAIEAASHIIRTDYTREREKVIVGGEARCLVTTLPQMVLRGPNKHGFLNKVNGLADIGEIGNRRYFYTRSQRMEKKLVVTNGRASATIIIDRSRGPSDPVILKG